MATAAASVGAREWTTAAMLRNAKTTQGVTQLELYQWCANHCVFRVDEFVERLDINEDHFPAVQVKNRTGDTVIRDMYLDLKGEVQVVVSKVKTGETTTVPIRDVKPAGATEVKGFMGRTPMTSKNLALLAATIRLTRLKETGMLVMVGANPSPYDLFGTGQTGFPSPSYQIVGQLAKVPTMTDQTLSITPYIIAGHFQELRPKRVIKVDIRGLDKVRVADNKEEEDLEAIAKAISVAYNRLAGGTDAEFTIEVRNNNEIITLTTPGAEAPQEFVGGIHDLRTNSLVNEILETGEGARYAKLVTKETLARSFVDTEEVADLVEDYSHFQEEMRQLEFPGLADTIEIYDDVIARLFPREAARLPSPPLTPPVSLSVIDLEQRLAACRLLEEDLVNDVRDTRFVLERRTAELDDAKAANAQLQEKLVALTELEPRPSPAPRSPPAPRKKDPVRLAKLRARVKELGPKLMALEKKARRDPSVRAEAEAAREQMDALTTKIYRLLGA